MKYQLKSKFYFLVETVKLILKLIWKCKGPEIAEMPLKNRIGRFIYLIVAINKNKYIFLFIYYIKIYKIFKMYIYTYMFLFKTITSLQRGREVFSMS